MARLALLLLLSFSFASLAVAQSKEEVKFNQDQME